MTPKELKALLDSGKQVYARYQIKHGIGYCQIKTVIVKKPKKGGWISVILKNGVRRSVRLVDLHGKPYPSRELIK